MNGSASPRLPTVINTTLIIVFISCFVCVLDLYVCLGGYALLFPPFDTKNKCDQLFFSLSLSDTKNNKEVVTVDECFVRSCVCVCGIGTSQLTTVCESLLFDDVVAFEPCANDGDGGGGAGFNGHDAAKTNDTGTEYVQHYHGKRAAATERSIAIEQRRT